LHTAQQEWDGEESDCLPLVDLTAEDISEDEENRSEDVNPVDEDGESDPDNDADPGSPLLDSMLSDRQPALNRENVMASMAIVAHAEPGICEPAEDNWEDL